jgi:hypothetical protein
MKLREFEWFAFKEKESIYYFLLSSYQLSHVQGLGSQNFKQIIN